MWRMYASFPDALQAGDEEQFRSAKYHELHHHMCHALAMLVFLSVVAKLAN